MFQDDRPPSPKAGRDLTLLLARRISKTENETRRNFDGQPHPRNQGHKRQHLTVINTNDSGAGSLRQAILSANTNVGTDTINFNIPGTGVHTITLASDLPAITDPVIIDGYTQPGATQNTLAVGENAALRIEVNGNSKGGFHIITGGDGSTIKGLVLNRFGCDVAGICGAVKLRSNNNVVSGNFIGTDVGGDVDLFVNTQDSNIFFEGKIPQSLTHDRALCRCLF